MFPHNAGRCLLLTDTSAIHAITYTIHAALAEVARGIHKTVPGTVFVLNGLFAIFFIDRQENRAKESVNESAAVAHSQAPQPGSFP